MIPSVNNSQWQLSQKIGETLGGVTALAANGELFYAGNDGSLTEWEVSTWQQKDSVTLNGVVLSIQIMANNLFCLTGSGVAKFSLSPLNQLGSTPAAMSYTLDNTSLYTVDGSKSIRKYDQNTLVQTALFNTSLEAVNQIAFAAGILAVIGSPNQTNSIGFYDSSTGVEQKVVSVEMNIPTLQTTLGGNFLLYDTFIQALPAFQVWNSSTFQLQTTKTFDGRPIAAIVNAAENIFVASSQILQLKNDCALPVTEKFSENPMGTMALVNENTLITGFLQQAGIAVWKKEAVESAPRESTPDWSVAQEIKLGAKINALGILGQNIYTVAGNTIQRWVLNAENQLTCATTNTLNGQIIGMVTCGEQLFLALNSTQLISVDPTTLQPGAAFTSGFQINCLTASPTKIYLGCASGIVYFVDPVSLTGMQIGTNQKGINTIAVTEKALEVTANGELCSYNPETGEALQDGSTGYDYPMSMVVGENYALTAEASIVSNNPFGMQIFPLTTRGNATLVAQTELSVEIPVFAGLSFEDQILLGGSDIQRFTNDIDLRPLGTLKSGVALKMLKLNPGAFLSAGDDTFRLWVRGSAVAATEAKPWCVVQ